MFLDFKGLLRLLAYIWMNNEPFKMSIIYLIINILSYYALLKFPDILLEQVRS